MAPAAGVLDSSHQIVYGLQPDCAINDKGRFNICLDIVSLSGSYEHWMDGFGQARDRWESIIVDDDRTPTHGFKLAKQISPNFIATELPDAIDDCYVSAFESAVDGPSGFLGIGGPVLATNVKGKVHVLAGFMEFDTADISNMVSDGTWENVILHEMAHVLGIGTLWQLNKLHSGSTNSDLYRGPIAQAKWAEIGCSGNLPVETDGGAGTAGGHWDESCLNEELMTGFRNPQMYLSAITIASLEDMGYKVDYSAADPYGLEHLTSNCGDYCPEAGTRRLRRELVPGKAKMSEQGRGKVLKEAAKFLKKARDNAPELFEVNDFIYVGGDLVTIYYEEGGNMFDVTVAWEDVKDLA